MYYPEPLRPILVASLLCLALCCPAGAAPHPDAYIPGQVLVKYKSASAGQARQAQLQPAGTRVKAHLSRLNCQVLQLAPGLSVRDALEYYRAQPEVAYAEPNYRIQLFAAPNDPRRTSLWNLDLIGAPQAWDQTTGDPAVVVAIIDTGLDVQHADIAANVWTNPGEIPGNNLDDDHNGYVDDVHGLSTFDGTGEVMDDAGHGTHVAGTIGGAGNNGLGVTGINWRVTLLPVKIFTADDSTGTAGAVEAYEYLIALKQRGVNIRVVNNSWGGPVPSQALNDAIGAAEAAGILSVCAAGNSQHNTDDRPEYPANFDCASLISVAASTREDELASFSNYGALTVDLAAPGASILSTYRGAEHYLRMSGTSMACPHVAGAAALLLAKNNSLTPAALKALLLATVDLVPQCQGRTRSGGRLNLDRAMARLLTGSLPSPIPETNQVAAPWPRLAGLSRNAQGRWGNAASLQPSLSTNGQWVAFLSVATNLAAADPGALLQAYLLDRAAGITRLVSVPPNGAQPNGECSAVCLSGDGRFVVFASESSNLVPNDRNSASDVFLYDRSTGQLELISVAGASVANDVSESPAISQDGRYVVFASDAWNLVAGDNNGYRDIFVRDRQLRTTTRVSLSSAGAEADYTSDLPAISPDGRFVSFLSGAATLVADAYYPAFHLYLRDRSANTTERLSKNASGQPGDANCGYSSLSADGRYIAFESKAGNLVAGDTNNLRDIFLWDRVARVLKLISLANSGAPSDQDCWAPFVTANGRHVFFFGSATTLCQQDDDYATDIFDYDLLTAKLSRLTYNQAGLTGRDDSYLPVASADGRWVAFDSWAWNLVPGKATGARHVLLLDRGEAIPDLMIYTPGETLRHGVGLHGVNIVQRRELPLTNNSATFHVRLDNDGPSTEVFSVRVNAAPAGWSAQFFHGATNLTTAMSGAGFSVALLPGGNVVLRLEVTSLNAALGESQAEWFITATASRTNAATDAVRAVVTRTPSPPALTAVSRAANRRLGNDATPAGDLSADARFVAFTSAASDLVDRDYNLQEDVFLLDRQTQLLECVSRQASGSNTGNGRSYGARISRDGRYVTFQSSATTLIADDTNDRHDVFLYDRQTRTLARASVGPGGVQSARESGSPRLSGDSRYLAFESLAPNFVAGDNNGTWDIFLRDTAAGTVQCLSLAGSQTADDESHSPVISSDGSLVVFSSLAGNLAPLDTNGVSDLFLWQRGGSGVQLLSRAFTGAAASDTSGEPSISDDNRYILFTSLATNLPVAAFDPGSIIFLYDRQTAQFSQLNPPRLTGRQRGSYYGPRLAPNGRLITLLADVAPASGATNYVTGVFLYDRISGVLTELSRRRDGIPGNEHASGATISADGRYVALASRAANLIGETVPAMDQLFLYDAASFQPDEWIRRGGNAPERGQALFGDSAQRLEQTLKPGFTNNFYVTLRNYGTVPDRFLLTLPLVIHGGIDFHCYDQTTGAEITLLVTNSGWTTDWIPAGATREIRLRLVASNTNVFNYDFALTSASLSDPTKTDIVRMRFLRDEDNDELPDAWEQQHFLNATNALAAADDDGDSCSNFQEYLAGTDPKNVSSNLRLTHIQSSVGLGATVTWWGAANRIYSLERATVAPAAFTSIADFQGKAAELSYRDPWPTNSAFYRLRVELP